MKLIYITILTAGLIFLSGCKSQPANENISSGERTFKSNCQSCHILPKPTLKTDDEWVPLVNKYGDKIKLSQQDINSIIGYLQSSN